MIYEISGQPLAVVECQLDEGESINCDGGAMSWMSANMKMRTSGSGLKNMFSRALSGENMFQNTYTAEGNEGYIAFAAKFPGTILAIELDGSKTLIAQKSAYLAASTGIKRSIFFQKKIASGLFGGEGFIMQQFSGEGVVFLEVDGSIVEKQLQNDEKIIVDTGYLAIMDGSCSIDVESVKGVKNAI